MVHSIIKHATSTVLTLLAEKQRARGIRKLNYKDQNNKDKDVMKCLTVSPDKRFIKTWRSVVILFAGGLLCSFCCFFLT